MKKIWVNLLIGVFCLSAIAMGWNVALAEAQKDEKMDYSIPLEDNSAVQGASNQNAGDWIGELDSPKGLKFNGQEVDPENVDGTVSNLVEFIINLAFGIAVLLVLGNLIFGAYQWIMSGGKSDKIAAGRNRMIWALVGLVMVAAAWGLTVLIQGIFIENNGQLQVDLIGD